MTIDALVRASVTALRPYVPGTTVEEARRKYGLERIVKLSSNENPWGSSPRAMAALRHIADLNIYANDDYAHIRRKIAELNDVPFEGIVCGHGSNEILAQFCHTFLEAGDEVVMADPSFSLYRADTLAAGAIPVEIPLRDGVHDLDAMAAAVTSKTKMVILCDPNNPTATQVERADFDRFLERLPERVILMLDQAYREFAEGGVEGAEIVRRRANTIVLRTASKAWGLAALRFGYGMTSPEIAGWLGRTRVPFNVSAPALVAMDAALDDDEFLRLSVRANRNERVRLEEAFAKLGLSRYPSQANFIAVSVPSTATEAYEGLLKRGVIVRSGDGLRLPGYLRITIGTPEQNEILLAAMAEFLDQYRGAAAKV